MRLFYNLLPQRHRWAEKQGDLAEFVVDETFSVPGVGTVVAGTVKKGVIVPNTTLLMGEWVQHARAEEGQRVGLLPSSLCPPRAEMHLKNFNCCCVGDDPLLAVCTCMHHRP